jgi:hypothetical protein
MRHAIDTILLDANGLKTAVREADRNMMARAGDRSAPPIYLAGKVSVESHPVLYHALKNAPFTSEITGSRVNRYTGEKDDIDTVIHDKIDTTIEAQMPLGYIIPAAWKELADVLALHGVEVQKIAKPLDQQFETYRFSNTKYAATSFEGRVMLNFDVRLVKEHVIIPAQSYWVPLKQRRARLIFSMLEPEAPDSLAKWGFCDAVFEGGGQRSVDASDYLSEPIARRMMADSPELRKEFEAKLAADSAFAADPKARLAWWFSRSKYEPGDTGRYPVVRVWDKNW